jgi:hypothetical protein
MAADHNDGIGMRLRMSSHILATLPRFGVMALMPTMS